MVEMLLKLFNTLNQQEQSVSTGGYNVPDGAHLKPECPR